MGLWQKTLFYLGLVDEDAPEYEAAPRDQDVDVPTGGQRSPYAPPVRAERQQAQPSGRSQPPLRSPGVDQVPPSMTTGERMAANRRPSEPLMPRTSGVQGRRVEPPLTARRRPVADRALSEAGVVVTSGDRPLVRTVTDADLESEVIVARSYTDAQILADHIRANIPVVLDLRKVEPAMVRRLVDFASGLTYALGGSMRKIGQGVILVNPANVNISRDEKRRLKELGYYQAPEEP
jgi:FtsZ-interacting cell division protein YlmF